MYNTYLVLYCVLIQIILGRREVSPNLPNQTIKISLSLRDCKVVAVREAVGITANREMHTAAADGEPAAKPVVTMGAAHQVHTLGTCPLLHTPEYAAHAHDVPRQRIDSGIHTDKCLRYATGLAGCIPIRARAQQQGSAASPPPSYQPPPAPPSPPPLPPPRRLSRAVVASSHCHRLSLTAVNSDAAVTSTSYQPPPSSTSMPPRRVADAPPPRHAAATCRRYHSCRYQLPLQLTSAHGPTHQPTNQPTNQNI